MGRAPCSSKVELHRGPWTAEEDMLLTKFIQANGEGQWKALPKRAGLLRCGKSCRLRWLNYLRPDIKRGNITPDEEELIIRMHKLLGNRWSLIAGRLPGRTDNEIKNFWNTQLSKKLVKKGVDPKTHQPVFRKEDARVSTDFVNKEEHPMTKKKDMESDRKNLSDLHVQPVYMPKANRYIALPRFVSSPDINGLSEALNVPESHASDVLLSPSIYLSPVNDHVPQSILPHNANDNPQDFFPWPCTDEEKERSLSSSQSAEGSRIPNYTCIIGNEQIGLTGANNSIPSPETKPEFGHINKPDDCLSAELRKVYEEYLEFLLEDPSDNNSGALSSFTADNDGEDIPVLQKHFSSMWDRLQGNEELLKEHDKQETLSFQCTDDN